MFTYIFLSNNHIKFNYIISTQAIRGAEAMCNVCPDLRSQLLEAQNRVAELELNSLHLQAQMADKSKVEYNSNFSQL